MYSFSDFLNKPVKALYLDDGKTKVVKGILQEVNDHYIIVENVVVGLGQNFISCVLLEGDNV